MCRSIKTLRGVDPPATREDIRAAARQFVRKVSGFHKPSKSNEPPFEKAVDEVADAAERLLAAVTRAKEGAHRAPLTPSSDPSRPTSTIDPPDTRTAAVPE